LAQAFCLLSFAIIGLIHVGGLSTGIDSLSCQRKITHWRGVSFKYNAHADYVSLAILSVWLLTDKPSHFSSSASFASGYYFGTYEEPNYPGEPAYFF